jgi:hypothetical protein
MPPTPVHQRRHPGALGGFATWLAVCSISLLASLASVAAHAEFKPSLTSPKTLPASLHWQAMPEIAFGDKAMYARPVPKPELVQLAKSMWADELAKQQSAAPNTPQYVMLASQTTGATTVTAAVINLPMDFERCEPPLNGKSVSDMYSKCLLRVALTQGGRTATAQFSDVCYLYIDNDPVHAPLAGNHTEFALDAGTATVYLRVIQHGQPVAACNRAVRLN